MRVSITVFRTSVSEILYSRGSSTTQLAERTLFVGGAMNEKRTFSRWKKRILLDIHAEGRTASGFTWDISHTGLSISSQYVPKLGEHLKTILHLPKGKTVECHGTVVRVRRVPLALADELGGSGFCLALGGYFEEYSRFLGDLK